MDVVPENPGIFATGTGEIRTAMMMHGSAYASGSVSVDGTVNAGDVGTITIAGTDYTYTVESTDTDLTHVTTGLINAINNASPPAPVIASAAGVFTRVILQAKVAGKAGESITYSATVSSAAQLLLTPSGTALCCDNTGMVTASNPAISGEEVIIYATGLGVLEDMTHFRTGFRFPSGTKFQTQPVDFVSSLAGGKTANVLESTPLPGSVGIFAVTLELNSGLTTDSADAAYHRAKHLREQHRDVSGEGGCLNSSSFPRSGQLFGYSKRILDSN